MTAFSINSGGTVNFDSLSGGSTNDTLDSYTISAGSTLLIRTDTYACPNHSTAFGSLDDVSASGLGGTLKFDPTYTREIAYTGGSGTVPAYGTTISQGGVSGVFLGVWADWQSQTVVPGGTVPASGYIKLGGITGGSFAAGALTGITATCSGADKQSWIECLFPNSATWTLSRLLSMRGPTSTVWYELGTTNGSRGQIIPCPTTGSFAGVWPGAWVETGAGTGIYEQWYCVGTMAATATTRTDSSCKMIWQTTSGLRFGNDGTNNVGFLPPTGCKVRIPAIILNTCARTVSGTGNRTSPPSNIDSRGKIVTNGGGAVDIKGFVFITRFVFVRAYLLSIEDTLVNSGGTIQDIKTPLNMKRIIVTPYGTDATYPSQFYMNDCRQGGVVDDFLVMRSSVGAGISTLEITNCLGLEMNRPVMGSVTKKASGGSYALRIATCAEVTINDFVGLGGVLRVASSAPVYINNPTSYEHLVTDAPNESTGSVGVSIADCFGEVIIDGFSVPLPAYSPYYALIEGSNSAGLRIRGIGSFNSPLALSSTVTGSIFGTSGCSDVRADRCYATGMRGGPFGVSSFCKDVVVSHVYGDYADTASGQLAGTNCTFRNCGYSSNATASNGVVGSHWEWIFTSATAGAVQIRFNEPNSSSSSQCYAAAGTPLFSGSGSVLLPVVGDAMIWEMPYYALGYTAFTNSLPTIAGTNATSAGSGVWGNHLIEFAINTGGGYGSWLTLTGANLSAQSITPGTGFKLKVRITCQVASTTNDISYLKIDMTTTSSDQGNNLYPMDTFTLSLSGIISGSDIVILEAGTTNIIEQVDANAGTTYDFIYETAQDVDIGILKSGYKPTYVRDYTLPSENSTLLITQTVDYSYA